MTLNLISQNTTIKSSTKSKRRLAAWSTSRLQELLGLQTDSQRASNAVGPQHTIGRITHCNRPGVMGAWRAA
jgi:hypothetical protein